ncbi:MAG: glutamine-hydrolyzing GMP synthase [Anaerolineales bacterium]|nr:glutamine-hydrolyzing GMP synthase [Anaerolineales bacterium]
MDSIAILDFGSQYTQLIARRVREAHVYCEMFPHDAPPEQVLALQPKAFILSGGPNSVYEKGAPRLPGYVLESGRPVLGICYGMQLLAQAFGGHVVAAARREYGRAQLQIIHHQSPLFTNIPATSQVWASHGDRVDRLPPGFRIVAESDNCPIAAMEDTARGYFAIQFHPEVNHTEHGRAILQNFLRAAQVKAEWTPGSMVAEAVARIRAQVGEAPVIAGVSGGVDSTVAAALVHRAIGDRLTCIFVDTGLLRAGEAEAVIETFRDNLHAQLVAVNAAEEFLDALSGVTDPEQKRSIIGEKFIRIFEREAFALTPSPSPTGKGAGGEGEPAKYLVQGTIYPDVVESAGPERQAAAKIKTHHNVGGLPKDMKFQLVEPLRYLFKDEVRAVGLELGLPEAMVWRQPFPGPGLAVRCLGEVTWERLERLRAADKIVTDELGAAGLLRNETAQAFAVLLPVRSVGVMGDGRTYGEVCALRAVTTEDFMTADWARLPYDVLARISSRIVNEVPGINRVVYDISSKPPATIEWE